MVAATGVVAAVIGATAHVAGYGGSTTGDVVNAGVRGPAGDILNAGVGGSVAHIVHRVRTAMAHVLHAIVIDHVRGRDRRSHWCWHRHRHGLRHMVHDVVHMVVVRGLTSNKDVAIRVAGTFAEDRMPGAAIGLLVAGPGAGPFTDSLIAMVRLIASVGDDWIGPCGSIRGSTRKTTNPLNLHRVLQGDWSLGSIDSSNLLHSKEHLYMTSQPSFNKESN